MTQPTSQAVANALPPTSAWRTREEAEVLRIEADIKLRTRVAVFVLLIFAALNVGVMYFLVHALSVDIQLLHTLPTAERLIDSKVVMSVVAATAAQVGVAIVTIVSHLFPRVSGCRNS